MKNSERIPVIDFLRGLSCLGVLLYHVRVDLWIGWWRITSYPQEYSSFAKTMAWLSIPTPFMGYAVVLFFLISGFCIHYPNTSGSIKTLLENLFNSSILENLPGLFCRLAFHCVHKLPLPNPVGRQKLGCK